MLTCECVDWECTVTYERVWRPFACGHPSGIKAPGGIQYVWVSCDCVVYLQMCSSLEFVFACQCDDLRLYWREKILTCECVVDLRMLLLENVLTCKCTDVKLIY